MVMDLGCWVLPSRVRSLKDHRTLRSHPNKAVDVVPTKLFRYLLALRAVNLCRPFVFASSSHGSPPFGPVHFLLSSGSLGSSLLCGHGRQGMA